MKELMKSSIKKWKTNLDLDHEKGTLTSTKINISSRIFLGASLSPLLLCIALAPLSLSAVDMVLKQATRSSIICSTWMI